MNTNMQHANKFCFVLSKLQNESERSAAITHAKQHDKLKTCPVNFPSPKKVPLLSL